MNRNSLLQIVGSYKFSAVASRNILFLKENILKAD
jgi:hypothetical protein